MPITVGNMTSAKLPTATDNVIDIAVPSHSPGDLLLAFVTEGADDRAISSNNGMVELWDVNYGTNSRSAAYWKQAGASEPGTFSFSLSGAGDDEMVAMMMAIAGAETASAADAGADREGGGDTTIELPAATALLPGSLAIAQVGMHAGGGNIDPLTPEGGWTEPATHGELEQDKALQGVMYLEDVAAGTLSGIVYDTNTNVLWGSQGGMLIVSPKGGFAPQTPLVV